GLWDSQVQYYEPTKWVAKLRATKTDANLLVLDIDMAAGHGGKSGRFDRLRDTAREFAFLMMVRDRPDRRAHWPNSQPATERHERQRGNHEHRQGDQEVADAGARPLRGVRRPVRRRDADAGDRRARGRVANRARRRVLLGRGRLAARRLRRPAEPA